MSQRGKPLLRLQQGWDAKLDENESACRSKQTPHACMEKTACIEPAVVPWARVRIGATVVTVTRDTKVLCVTPVLVTLPVWMEKEQ